MAKTRTEFSTDTSQMSYFSGLIDGISAGVQTDAYVGSVIPMVHAKLNAKFELFMDALAMTNHQALHHVYEWGQIGLPNGRLWESVLRGRGQERTSSIVWKASTKAVPVPDELTEPGNTGKSVKTGVHIFYWKAPVMESGATVTVEPKLSENLAFLGYGGIKFSKRRMSFTAGGGKTTGQFLRNYYTWWNTMASDIYQREVMPSLQQDIAELVDVRRGMRRVKAFSIVSDKAMQRAGQAAGRKGVASNEREYILSAAARRALIYGN